MEAIAYLILVHFAWVYTSLTRPTELELLLTCAKVNESNI